MRENEKEEIGGTERGIEGPSKQQMPRSDLKMCLQISECKRRRIDRRDNNREAKQ